MGIAVALWRRNKSPALETFTPKEETQRAISGAWSGWRDFRVVRRNFEDSAKTQCSFYLEPVDSTPLTPFKPGQFLTFQLPVPKSGTTSATVDRPITRCYSLSDRPNSKTYRVTIKRVPAPADQPDAPPGKSSGFFHDQVQDGAILQVKAPAGHFFIDDNTDVPIVLIGGGIGITPMLSMLGWCLSEQPGRVVHLYYGLRNSDEHAFKAQLEQLANEHPHFHLNVVYSRPTPNDVLGRDYQHAGHVNVDLLKANLLHGRHQFYVCGPPAMMESLVPALAKWGVPRDDIHFEAFGPASIRLPGDSEPTQSPAPSAPVEIQFLRSGRTLAWEGQDESLLNFAERHSIAIESGCRSGGCGSCETRLVSGSVHYAHQPDFDVAKGHCLMCVGLPSSALVLEA